MELRSKTTVNLGYEILELQRAVRRIVTASLRGEETGVTFQFVLRFLSEGDSRASRLAERLGVGAPVISRHIADLEEQGYVVRSKDPSDGRAHLLAITTSGADRLQQIDERQKAALMECLSDWNDEDAGNTARILQRLNETLAGPRRASGALGLDEQPKHQRRAQK